MIRTVAIMLLTAAAVAGCDPSRQPPNAGPPTTDETAPGSVEGPPDPEPSPPPPDRPDTPAERTPGRDPAVVVPELDGYRTEAADAGELRSSLDHGGVSYRAVRRFVVLADQEFVAGEITVLTHEPGSDDGERYLRHRYGDDRRTAVTIAGVSMLRIAATPHDAIAWSADGLVFTFERGQEQTHGWLEQVAAATVRAIRKLGQVPDLHRGA